jgi:hypothetical protein
MKVGARDAAMTVNKWSGMVEFRTAIAPPPTPTITCPGYPNGDWAEVVPSAPVPCTITVAGNATTSRATKLLYKVDNASGDTVVEIPAAGASVTVQVPNKNGAHLVTARTMQAAGKEAAAAPYGFGYGPAAFTMDVAGVKTTDTVRLSAAAPPPPTGGTVTASLDWRIAGDTGDVWRPVTNAEMGTSGTPEDPWNTAVTAQTGWELRT